jgi:hypothetical protein
MRVSWGRYVPERGEQFAAGIAHHGRIDFAGRCRYRLRIMGAHEMSGRNSSSSSRATGGINAAGNPGDTLIVLPGAGAKKILGISWAFSTLGGAFSGSDLLTSRIVVVGNVDLSLALQANVTTGFPDSLVGIAGQLLFDTQVVGGLRQDFVGNFFLPISGQFLFPADATEGKVGVGSGPISVLMTAPVQALVGGAPTNVQGVLTVQYDNNYDGQASRGYNYPRFSGPA